MLAAARWQSASLPLLWPVAALAMLLALVLAGVFLPRLGVFARPILAGPDDGARIALTFDDGPDERETRRILDLLDAAGHRATFFVIARRAQARPQIVREIVARGHALGNHSLDHAYTTPFRRADRLARDLIEAGGILQRIAGCTPRWFRPPVGLISPPVAEAARRSSLELVAWSAAARDGRGGARPDRCLARLRRGLRPGAILLLHDAAERGRQAPIAARILPQLLDELRRRGLQSVTLDELLA